MGTELEKREQRSVSNTAPEQIGQAGPAYSPDVDIYVSDDELLFAIDLPGVEKGKVKIEVNENDTLVVRAQNSHTEPQRLIVQQYRVGDYYRAFQIGEEYDKEKIAGKLENGMLQIRIPKREEAKPRRIEINA
jgi:HSP20 family protein